MEDQLFAQQRLRQNLCFSTSTHLSLSHSLSYKQYLCLENSVIPIRVVFSFARRWFWFCLLFPLRPIHMILPPSTCKQSHQKQLCEMRKNNYKHKHYITFFHSLSPHSQTHWNLQNWWKVFDSLQAFEETIVHLHWSCLGWRSLVKPYLLFAHAHKHTLSSSTSLIHSATCAITGAPL